MGRNKSIQFFFVIFISGTAFSVSVTFQVDMASENISSDGVYIKPYGGFNSYDDFQMLDVDEDNIYETIVTDLTEDEELYYLFKNGSSLEGVTNLAACGGGSRKHIVSDTDETVGPVCFSSCQLCGDVSVTIHVDMTNETISDEGVHIAGSMQSWDPASSDMTDTDGDGIYEITFNLTPGDTIQYKFINGNNWDGAENTSGLSDCSIEDDMVGHNRFHIVGESDDTLTPVCFGYCVDCSILELVTLSSLTFKANMSNAVIGNSFELGDILLIRWGYGGSQSGINIDTLIWADFSYNYEVTIDNVIIDPEVGLYYQYYITQGDREIYYNFIYNGDDNNLAERRYVSFIEASEYDAVLISDTEDSEGDPRRMPIFKNDNLIGQELTVTYTVDLRPAYYQVLSGDILEDTQGDIDIVIADSVFAWGVWMNGPATEPLTGESWTGWGNTLFAATEKKMHDDGITSGDEEAGDSIYTLQVTYDADKPIGQEFKFGIKGGDNEGGYGNNHIENINVQSPTIASYWGSIDPIFYDEWNYDGTLTVTHFDNLNPHQFELGSNYPNPFNPITTIGFTISHGSEVILSVYDIHGRLISTVHNAYTMPGTYKAMWNGQGKASGVYFYELSAKPYFNKTGKMILKK